MENPWDLLKAAAAAAAKSEARVEKLSSGEKKGGEEWKWWKDRASQERKALQSISSTKSFQCPLSISFAVIVVDVRRPEREREGERERERERDRKTS